MSFHTSFRITPHARRWWLVAPVALIALLVAGGTAFARMPHTPTRTAAAVNRNALRADEPMLMPFDASCLPAGKATGLPVHASFPAGTNVKHVHGGPTYVYVISGSLDIIETDGSKMTYGAGSFFAEGPGHIHTLQVPQAAEVFYLQFLPPGAESLVPVQ